MMTSTTAAKSDAEPDAEVSIGQSYVRLAAAAHASTGAIAWGSHAAVAPAAAAITLASCVALWTAFAGHGRTPRLVVFALSVVCILVTSFATYTGAIPDWLMRGPWSPLFQLIALGVASAAGVRTTTPPGERSDNGRLNDGSQRSTPGTDGLRDQNERSSSWSIGKTCAIVTGIALALYLVALPVGEELWSQIYPPPTSSVVEDMTLGEAMRLRAVQVFAAVWAFAFGACVGSFLNVLVYRQPRGESVLAKPSACPACSTKLETRDNLPVIGWMLLGGRCRTCRAPISSRYPVVEAIVGLVFAILVFTELTSGGANLPIRRVNTYTGFVWTIFYPKWDLIALTVYHFHLFAMLITWALMARDRVMVPWRSIVAAWLIAAGAPLAWNRLWIMPPGFVGDWNYLLPFPVIASAVVMGLATGAIMAAIASWVYGGSFRTMFAAYGLIGATLGWQAVLTIGVISVAVAAMVRLTTLPKPSLASLIALITFLHHFAWRWGFEIAQKAIAAADGTATVV